MRRDCFALWKRKGAPATELPFFPFSAAGGLLGLRRPILISPTHERGGYELDLSWVALPLVAKRVRKEFYRRQNTHPIRNLIPYPGQVIAGRIAQHVTKRRKGNPLLEKFWDQLPHTRIVEWGMAWRNVLAYIRKNGMETLGLVPYTPRKRKGSLSLNSS